MKLLKKTCAPLLLVGLCAPALVNCDALKGAGLPIPGCPAMDDGKFDALKLEGSAKVQADLKGFLNAVYEMRKHTVEMEKTLIESCAELGKGMSMDEAALKAEPADGEGAKKVCGAVGEKIKALIGTVKDATVKVIVGKPHCEIDVDGMLGCYKGCGAALDPKKLAESCAGGMLAGKCEAKCEGNCMLEPGAQCSGTCGGMCDGKCDGKKSSGLCTGKCEGKCKGGCSVSGKAKCDTLCVGGCSGELKLPKCLADFKPPVDPSCLASCAPKMVNHISCTPPPIDVVIEGKGVDKAKKDLQGLITALNSALPKIVSVELGTGTRLLAQGEALISFGKGLPEIAQQAGPSAITCIATATGIAGKVGATIKVAVDASASVGASAGIAVPGGAAKGSK
jgi:hypothetical protein